jgi:hypothetical protein
MTFEFALVFDFNHLGCNVFAKKASDMLFEGLFITSCREYYYTLKEWCVISICDGVVRQMFIISTMPHNYPRSWVWSHSMMSNIFHHHTHVITLYHQKFNNPIFNKTINQHICQCNTMSFPLYVVYLLSKSVFSDVFVYTFYCYFRVKLSW